MSLSNVETGLELRDSAQWDEVPVLIEGRVTLAGEIPTPDAEWDVRNDPYCSGYRPIKTKRWSVGENDALGDVVVALVGQSGGSIDSRPAGVDQAGCCYSPYVVAIAANESVVFSNSDETFHNVRIDRHKEGTLDGGTSLKNYGQPAGGKNIHHFPAAGVYRVQCDLHRWMRAWVYVHDSGYSAVTDEEGKFKIHGVLPDGEYELLAWHSEFPAPLRKTLTISGGAAKIDFEFSASNAMMAGANGK